MIAKGRTLGGMTIVKRHGKRHIEHRITHRTVNNINPYTGMVGCNKIAG